MRDLIWKREVISIPESGKLTIPIFGLYAGRPNRVRINLAFGGRFHPIKRLGMTITTPAYDGGTYSTQPSFSRGYRAPP